MNTERQANLPTYHPKHEGTHPVTDAATVAFKYMPNPKAAAQWTDLRCGYCSRPGPSFEAASFGPGQPVGGVCVQCLRTNRGPSRDVLSVRDKLKAAIKDRNPTWGGLKAERIADERADELGRTPPVPNLKLAAWAICCGDFSCVLGEWTRADWRRVSKDGNPQNALVRVLGNHKVAASTFKDIPEAAGQPGTLATFVFRCCECRKIGVVIQPR